MISRVLPPALPDLRPALRLAGLARSLVSVRFEYWQPALGRRFDLVFAATAWNWIDPARRYPHLACPAPWRPPGPAQANCPHQAAEIQASGLVEVVHIRHFDWELAYDADGGPRRAAWGNRSRHDTLPPAQRPTVPQTLFNRNFATRADALCRGYRSFIRAREDGAVGVPP